LVIEHVRIVEFEGNLLEDECFSQLVDVQRFTVS
jgi:hypothetical protein